MRNSDVLGGIAVTGALVTAGISTLEVTSSSNVSPIPAGFDLATEICAVSQDLPGRATGYSQHMFLPCHAPC